MASSTRRTVPKAIAILLLLVVAYFVLGRVARNMAITRLRDLGVSVKTKRVSQGLSPIPMPVCWVDVGDNVLDDMQLEQLFSAVRQININDCRVALGRTAVTQAQRFRLMESARNVQGHTIPPSTGNLTWVPINDSTDQTASRTRPPSLVYFRNESTSTVRIFGSSRRGNKLLATLAPDRTIQAIAVSKNPWMVTDENDKPLGYFSSDGFNGIAATAVIPAGAR